MDGFGNAFGFDRAARRTAAAEFGGTGNPAAVAAAASHAGDDSDYRLGTICAEYLNAAAERSTERCSQLAAAALPVSRRKTTDAFGRLDYQPRRSTLHAFSLRIFSSTQRRTTHIQQLQTLYGVVYPS